jgi:hypothetical protein
MSSISNFRKRNPGLSNTLLWLLAAIATYTSFKFQDKTGPTQPLVGDFRTGLGDVKFEFLRSEIIGTDLNVMLIDPVPDGIACSIRYRRFNSNDDWSTLNMHRGTFEFSRRGSSESVVGLGAGLPSLDERAGKYEYFVYIDDGEGEPVSVTGGKPIYARYKAHVPIWALVLHIFAIFFSMAFAVRTALEALADGGYKWMLKATIIILVLGAFVLGPLVQWYAFGVWWSGVPFGYDWTDNKVLVGLLFWLVALFLNRGKRRDRTSVYLAGIVTVLVFCIPHSIFGSEYNYRTGAGHGTAG